VHDGMQYYPIQGQGHEPSKVGNSAIFKGCLLPIYNGGLQAGKTYWSVFLVFVLVFVSSDFEVGSK